MRVQSFKPAILANSNNYGGFSNLKALTDIYINPYGGKILGAYPQNTTLMPIIHMLHTQFLAGEVGEFVVGFCGVLLLIRAISGLMIWPGWRKFSAGVNIRWKAPWQLIHYDFHKVIGLISVIFLVLAAITGSILTFNQPVRSLGYAVMGAPQPEKPISQIPKNQTTVLSLDDFLQKAEVALPGGRTTFIFPPSNEKATVRVRKRLDGEIHPNGRSFVYLDQYSGEVLRIENIYYSPWVEHIFAWTYPLHIGTYGGIYTRILYIILGLVPAFLFITGFVIFWNKTYGIKNKRK